MRSLLLIETEKPSSAKKLWAFGLAFGLFGGVLMFGLVLPIVLLASPPLVFSIVMLGMAALGALSLFVTTYSDIRSTLSNIELQNLPIRNRNVDRLRLKKELLNNNAEGIVRELEQIRTQNYAKKIFEVNPNNVEEVTKALFYSQVIIQCLNEEYVHEALQIWQAVITQDSGALKVDELNTAVLPLFNEKMKEAKVEEQKFFAAIWDEQCKSSGDISLKVLQNLNKLIVKKWDNLLKIWLQYGDVKDEEGQDCIFNQLTRKNSNPKDFAHQKAIEIIETYIETYLESMPNRLKAKAEPPIISRPSSPVDQVVGHEGTSVASNVTRPGP